MSRALLITGATGKQGGAVVNALLRAKADFEILAVTRNAQSPSAQKLLKKSSQIKLITGNLDDATDIFQKAREASSVPIWGVYSVQVSNIISSTYVLKPIVARLL
jgi:nucleoside-diphosphate-sugar epimerase